MASFKDRRAGRKVASSIVLVFALAGTAGTARAVLPGWSTQLPVTIIETSGSALADYQVRLVVDTAALIAGGVMNPDASDLRFGTDATGSTLLDYWIEGGVDTASAIVWIKVPALPASATTGLYLFTGNPVAPPVSSLDIFGYTDAVANSATNQVFAANVSGAGDCQRGFRFSPNEDILVTQFGRNEPNGSTRYITLFDNASQAILAQAQVSGPASQYSYATLSQPIWLQQGQQYLLEMFTSNSENYYFGAPPQVNPRLTFYDMRYCNGCTQDTFPQNSLAALQYGYPDFEFMTREHAASEPVATQTAGPTTTSLSSAGPVTLGQPVTFTASVEGVFGPTGSIGFLDGGNAIAGCDAVALDGGSPPMASCTATLGVGSHDITAVYGGDIDDAGSTSDVLAQVVDPVASTTLLGTACQTTFVENQPFTVAATVNGYDPTGSVTFSDAGNVLAIVPLASGGAAFTIGGFAVPAGVPRETHALAATYGGDAQNTTSASMMLLVDVLGEEEAILRNGFDATPASCPSH